MILRYAFSIRKSGGIKMVLKVGDLVESTVTLTGNKKGRILKFIGTDHYIEGVNMLVKVENVGLIPVAELTKCEE